MQRMKESGENYTIASARERLRRHYPPARVRILFVGESPPASGRFFYQCSVERYEVTEHRRPPFEWREVRGNQFLIRRHSLNHLDAKYPAGAAAQDRLFQFRFDRLTQDRRVGLFLPAQSALALVGRVSPFSTSGHVQVFDRSKIGMVPAFSLYSVFSTIR
jgi:hypothetical protein